MGDLVLALPFIYRLPSALYPKNKESLEIPTFPTFSVTLKGESIGLILLRMFPEGKASQLKQRTNSIHLPDLGKRKPPAIN